MILLKKKGQVHVEMENCEGVYLINLVFYLDKSFQGFLTISLNFVEL